MERFDADIRAVYSAFQETPEVLAVVGVDVIANIGFGVVDNLVKILTTQSLIRLQFVGVDVGTGIYMGANVILNGVLMTIWYHMCPDLAAALKDRAHDC